MILIECPHCGGSVEIVEINCAIFRHAYYKGTAEQIPPHTSAHECNRLFLEDAIYGCGGPFRLVEKNGSWEAEICDYL